MKKKFILFLVIIFFHFNFYSQENTTIKNKFLFGYLNGQINELLYYNSSNSLESRLDWDVTAPLISFDTEIDIKNLYFNLSTQTIFLSNNKSGFMQDYDWLKYNSTSNKYELTNYSKHTNYLDEFYKINFSAGYNFDFPVCIFTPYALLSSEEIKFSAYDGYTQYAPSSEKWSPDIPKNYLSGNIISYSQNIFSLGIGAKTQFNLFNKASINFNFDIKPYVNYLSYDFHIKKSVIYADNFFFSLYLDSNAEVLYKLTKNFQIGLQYKVEYLIPTKGKSYKTYATSLESINKKPYWVSIDDEGGSSRFLQSVNFVIQIIY